MLTERNSANLYMLDENRRDLFETVTSTTSAGIERMALDLELFLSDNVDLNHIGKESATSFNSAASRSLTIGGCLDVISDDFIHIIAQ